MERLKPLIVPLTDYLLNVTMPLKQTDHYLMKTFLRIVLFMNVEVASPLRFSVDPPLRQGAHSEAGVHPLHALR